MQITEDSELRKKAIAALVSEYKMDQQRPETHQSELSYCLTKAYWNVVDPEPPTEKEVLLFSIGFGMERVLLSKEGTPAELEVDGIRCSLDTVDLFGPSDLKTTRLRATGRTYCLICNDPYRGHSQRTHGHSYQRSEPEQFVWPEGWKRQFAAYRRVLNIYAERNGEPVGFTFGAIVMHLVEPEMTAWRIVYTREELEENWARLLTRRDWLESMIAAQNPEPFQTNEDWECKNCRYLLRCQLEGSLNALNTVS